MKEDEHFHFLRHYHHDISNDLQIIHGYTTMKQLDKVKEYTEKWMRRLKEQRSLLHINAEKFSQWLVISHHLYSNLEISYDIQVHNIDLSSIDDQLFTVCQNISVQLQNH